MPIACVIGGAILAEFVSASKGRWYSMDFCWFCQHFM